jgi:hypothetical protein
MGFTSFLVPGPLTSGQPIGVICSASQTTIGPSASRIRLDAKLMLSSFAGSGIWDNGAPSSHNARQAIPPGR